MILLLVWGVEVSFLMNNSPLPPLIFSSSLLWGSQPTSSFSLFDSFRSFHMLSFLYFFSLFHPNIFWRYKLYKSPLPRLPLTLTFIFVHTKILFSTVHPIRNSKRVLFLSRTVNRPVKKPKGLTWLFMEPWRISLIQFPTSRKYLKQNLSWNWVWSWVFQQSNE